MIMKTIVRGGVAFMLLGLACACGGKDAEPADTGSSAVPTPRAIVAAAVRDDQSTTEKVRAVVDWTHRHLDWTDTDYVERTLDQILQRGGGNCYEQAIVVVAALDLAGVKTRQTREINIQPENEQRQRDAEARVAEVGFSASVFGRRHNDHVWIEYWNEETGEWAPADPTLNLIGYEEWIRARMGYEGRPVHDIIPSRDMLVPIAVFAENKEAENGLEDRGQRYLIEGFAAYNSTAQELPEWTLWTEDVKKFSTDARAAFSGDYNLHQDTALIEELAGLYLKLKPAS